MRLSFRTCLATGCLVLSAMPAIAAEKPLGDWSPEDFAKSGRVVTAQEGSASSGRFELRNWEQPTLVNLRGAEFRANEDGAFAGGILPAKWPIGVEFQQLKEASQHEKYPVSIRGTSQAGLLVLGGRVIGVQPRELPWRFMKKVYDGDGVHLESPGEMIVDGTCFENLEDAVGPRGGGRWTVRRVHAKEIRDDFVENDGLLSGEIDDCLIEESWTLLSARPGKASDPKRLAGTPELQPHVVIRNTLFHAMPMPYDGDMKLDDQRYIVNGKAGGKIFKWSPSGGTVEVRDCVFRVDAMSASGGPSMAFPAGTYRNVKLVWLGEGDYPTPLPEGVEVMRDASVWEQARQGWLRRHASK